ncbi:MAG: FAD-binding protein [Microlunatus sp.]|nr:FAD-binding protein [Microlunatus sp.]
MPIGVVIPRDADDVIAAVEICHRHRVPIFARGSGTGLAGQSVNAAVMFDFSKYMRTIIDLDPQQRIARVQPGVVCDQLREAAAKYGLTFSVDPATHDRCTLGGMIGNNSCGTHSIMGGKTVDNVIELDVLTYDGVRMTLGPTSWEEFDRIRRGSDRRAEIHRGLDDLRRRYGREIRERYPAIPRRVSGYNLDELINDEGCNTAKVLVGSESTCVLVLEATVRLLEDPPSHSLLVVGFPDAATAADHVPELLTTSPIGLECFDAGVIDNMRKHSVDVPGMHELPAGAAWLLAEYGARTRQRADELVEQARARVTAPGVPKAFEDEQHQAEVWEIRRSAIEYTRIPGEHAGLAGWEDAAVAPERLGDYIRDYCTLVAEHGYHTVLFGHFGQGCLHNRLDLDLETVQQIDNFSRFLDRAGDLVVRYGGSLSGEHGDGQLRANQLEKMFGPDLVNAFAEFKALWDPEGMMNPGKVVRPNRPVDNLRQGADYRPRQLQTQFAYPDDQRGFGDAVNRCFGIGLCRHTSGGTMCPSYMVTHEEEHSTRGRSRLLFEMMSGHLGEGSPDDAGWRDEHVLHALDLCLSCKGCKGDCPVNVDMATYKAEFSSHYYAGRLRPRAAYALGLIPVWARLAALAPGLVNTALHAPIVSRIGKLAAGVAAPRRAPEFAARTFREWFAERPAIATDQPSTHGPTTQGTVLLWPDTWTNHFQPQIAIAAVEVLEDAGFTVRVPAQELCCGRPLYEFGMVPTAKRWLSEILDDLRQDIAAGVPVVGLEPSCVAVFRDELPNLFPDDVDAHRLARQTYTFAELLAGSGYRPPRLNRKALLQRHCHQQAVLSTAADDQLMDAIGLDVQRPDSGCCGMAGAFGYERGDKYRVSVAAGERVLLPAVRAAAPDTLILADGFSCREQIEQQTDRRALHLSQVIDLARRTGSNGPQAEPVERAYASNPPRSGAKVAAGSAALLAGLVAAWYRSRTAGSHGSNTTERKKTPRWLGRHRT